MRHIAGLKQECLTGLKLINPAQIAVANSGECLRRILDQFSSVFGPRPEVKNIILIEVRTHTSPSVA